MEQLAKRHGLFAYDRRGTGRSSGPVPDLSLDVEIDDMLAVADAAGVASFDLFAFDSIPAVAFAARHPDRVRRLVLYQPILAPRYYGHAIEVIRTDWTMARRALSSILYPEGPIELQKHWSDSVRDFVPQQVAAAYAAHEEETDLRDIAPDIQAPTLIIKTEMVRPLRADEEDAAALIPDARIVNLPGRNHWYHDPDRLAATVMDFLGHRSSTSDSLPASQTGLTVILFADIANSTALTERLGDSAFRDKARALDDALRSAITSAGGAAVEGKLLGDGVLAVFTSARDAIACASEMHRIADAGGAGGGLDPRPSTLDPLRLHVGIHAGDVIREGGNVFGGAVNIAARVSDASSAGETFVSQTVRDLARTSAGVAFDDRGEHALKGIDEPQRLFAVRDE